jgi:hypothetical protein
MDWIIWLVVIVAIVAVVWWLLNRNSSRGRSGSAGTGPAAADGSTPPHLHDVDHDASHRGALSGGGSAASASAAGLAWMPTSAGFNQAEPEVEPEPAPDPVAAAEDAAAVEAHEKARAAAASAAAAAPDADTTHAAKAAPPAAEAAAAESPQWETQWSETPSAEPHAAVHQEPGRQGTGHQGPGVAGAAAGAGVMDAPATGAAAGVPVHHAEYTELHAPTLPGAESAAAEAEAETAAAADDRLTGGHEAVPAEPAGHLAADQPYGEGSAAPGADGSGPEGFTVKGNASSMTYHDEDSPAFEETRAEVWFLSVAHAEAAGFRPPRRTRQ